jgi:hypothetical protein
MAIALLLAGLLRGTPGGGDDVSIVQAASDGNIDLVKDIVRKTPEKVMCCLLFLIV